MNVGTSWTVLEYGEFTESLETYECLEEKPRNDDYKPKVEPCLYT